MSAMGAKPATRAQKAFAAAVVGGATLASAYRKAHPGATGSAPGTIRTAAKVAKQSKAVQREIARLMADPLLQPAILESCPEASNPGRLREHAVGIMLKLSRHADPLVAVHCAEWLASYADKLIAESERTRSIEPTRQQILADLRGLYAKALARPAAPPLVETVNVESATYPAEPVAEPAKPAQGE